MQANEARDTSSAGSTGSATGNASVVEGVTIEQVQAAVLASPWEVDSSVAMRTRRISPREVVVLWSRRHEHEPFVVHRAYPGEGPERALLQGGGYHATLEAAQRDYTGR